MRDRWPTTASLYPQADKGALSPLALQHRHAASSTITIYYYFTWNLGAHNTNVQCNAVQCPKGR